MPIGKFTKKISAIIVSTVSETVESKFTDLNIRRRQVNNAESIQSMMLTEDWVQHWFNRPKEGTEKMFKDIELDYDLLTDLIHRLESTVQNLQKTNRQ